MSLRTTKLWVGDYSKCRLTVITKSTCSTMFFIFFCLHVDQNILTKRDAVDAFLKQFSSVFNVVNLVENPSAKSGTQLFKRFQTAWKGLNPNKRKTMLAFHGTPEANIQSICTNGFDPSRRKGQACGPGEYFAKTPTTSLGYCGRGKKMLLCELLLGDVNTHHTIHGDIVVMKDPAHDLPRFVVEFS